MSARARVAAGSAALILVCLATPAWAEVGAPPPADGQMGITSVSEQDKVVGDGVEGEVPVTGTPEGTVDPCDGGQFAECAYTTVVTDEPAVDTAADVDRGLPVVWAAGAAGVVAAGAAGFVVLRRRSA